MKTELLLQAAIQMTHLQHKASNHMVGIPAGNKKAGEVVNMACSGLRGKLPKEINLPASVTVPFGSFEEVLSQAANKQIKKELQAAINDIPAEKAEEALAKCRELVMQVTVCDTCDLYVGLDT